MAKAATVITASTVVRGRVEGSEDLDILGRVEGQIAIEGSVKIDGAARVDATVSATDLHVHGILVGDASATGTIHLTADAQVVGDLTAPRIIIDDGARIRGMVDMGDADNAAPKSRSSASRTSRPKAAPAPAPVAADEDDDDDEPELPSGASAKKVAVKKRR